jgi:signal peptidase I
MVLLRIMEEQKGRCKMSVAIPNKAKQEGVEYNFNSELWDWSKSLLIALVAVIVTNQFIVTQCKVIGSSMRPTLMQGERLLINRIIYKFRAPHRGEVITLIDPDPTQVIPIKNLVKRVVAIAGDKVEIRSGLMYINGALFKEKYTDVSIEDGDWGPLKISAGQVLVMGDNRHLKASRDSRIFGAVSTKLIIGRVEVVLWPLNKIKGL